MRFFCSVKLTVLAFAIQAAAVSGAFCFPHMPPTDTVPATITIDYDGGGDVDAYEARVDAAVASGAFVRIPYYAVCISACNLWLDQRLIAAGHLCVDNDATFKTHEVRRAPAGDYLARQSSRADARTAEFEGRLAPAIRAMFDKLGAFAGPWLSAFSGELVRDASPSIPQCSAVPDPRQVTAPATDDVKTARISVAAALSQAGLAIEAAANDATQRAPVLTGAFLVMAANVVSQFEERGR